MVKELALREQVEGLYVDHHGWLHGWLRGKLGNVCIAAELAHDTFVRVLTSGRMPAHMGSEPRALLTHIAKGLVVDHWRRQAIERAYLDALAVMPAQEAPSPEAGLIIVQALCRVEAMLQALPSRTRDIFLSSQLDGLSYAHIADRYGVSLITVKRHMQAAFAACLMLD